MKAKYLLKELRFVSLLLMFATALQICAAGEKESMPPELAAKWDAKLERVRLEERIKAICINRVHLPKAETSILELVNEQADEAAKAKAYLAIANMYSSDIPGHCEKVIHFSKQALAYPQKTVDACGLFLDLSKALELHDKLNGSQPSIETRGEIVKLCLRALHRIALDQVPERLQLEPRLGRATDLTGAWSKEELRVLEQKQLDRENDRRMAREKMERQNDLVAWRVVFTEKLAELCTGSSDGMVQLSNAALEEFNDAGVVDKLLKSIEATRSPSQSR